MWIAATKPSSPATIQKAVMQPLFFFMISPTGAPTPSSR